MANILGTDRLFGFDFSKYDGLLNWSMVIGHTPKPHFAGIRSSISWGYVDPFFKTNRLGSMNVGLPCFPYEVLYPGEDYVTQCNNFLSANESAGLGSATWEGAHPVIDIELDHGQTQEMITNKIMSMAEYLQGRIGKRPLGYSRATWLDQFTLEGEWRNSLRWWLADYLPVSQVGQEQNEPPLLPAGVTTYFIHQNAEKYPVPVGFSQRTYTDCDRGNFTEDELHVFFYGVPQDNVGIRLDALELRATKLEAIVSELDTRMGVAETKIIRDDFAFTKAISDLETRMEAAETTLTGLRAL